MKLRFSCPPVLIGIVAVSFPAAAGDVETPLVINDKSPVAYPAPATGWFGGVEATFMKMNRADGMRYDDIDAASVDTDYSFTPRYTLGYRTSENAGIRARFWGDFNDTSIPYVREDLTDRFYAEASTFELDMFRSFSVSNYEFELSAGLQYADFYEGMIDNNGPNTPESAKGADGWGPVVGFEVKRDLAPGLRFFGKARHSLLMTDGSISETSGPVSLQDSNGGITEIGLGLEHTRVVGNAAVTLRGGYEWQQWHNFSYGFEDTESEDDVAGPADAGFHGFVLGVSITGRGADDPVGNGVGSYGLGDFGLAGSSAGGLYTEFESTFFEYNRADGLRGGDSASAPGSHSVDMDSQYTPRYTLGYRGSDGGGIRARFWGDYNQRGLPENPTYRGEESFYAEASAVDLELFDTFILRDYDLELSLGVQSANFFEGMANDAQGTGFSEAKSATGWGPVVGVELSRQLGSSTSGFVKARHSLLMTNSSTVDNSDEYGFQNGAIGGITEIGFGLEHSRVIGNAEVTLRGGYEWQRWHNFGFAFEDSMVDDDPSGTGDAGFNGFLVGVGIAGAGPSVGSSLESGKGAKFVRSEPEWFLETEATFFKSGRADGMRYDYALDESVESTYDFAPRYTLGYRLPSGPGIRGRYWGEFDERNLPDNGGFAGALDVEASALDIEMFDTFSIGEFDLELSAGIQRASYAEETFEGNGLNTPETSKSSEGWGPVIGAKVERPFLGGSVVSAKARHSLLLTDALVTNTDDDGGDNEVFLDGANGGVTELGFGIKKALSVGNAEVTVSGGYEWQQWHNASYGFEDSNDNDDVSGPADASFQGFTIGIEIRR